MPPDNVDGNDEAIEAKWCYNDCAFVLAVLSLDVQEDRVMILHLATMNVSPSAIGHRNNRFCSLQANKHRHYRNSSLPLIILSLQAQKKRGWHCCNLFCHYCEPSHHQPNESTTNIDTSNVVAVKEAIGANKCNNSTNILLFLIFFLSRLQKRKDSDDTCTSNIAIMMLPFKPFPWTKSILS